MISKVIIVIAKLHYFPEIASLMTFTIVMIVLRIMWTKGLKKKSVASYLPKPTIIPTLTRTFALTRPCFGVIYCLTKGFVIFLFTLFLYHKDTELKLHEIYIKGMSAESGCKPSCEEWSYNAFQRVFTKESEKR